MIPRTIKKSRRIIASLIILLLATFAFLKLTATKSQAAWFDDSWAYHQKNTL